MIPRSFKHAVIIVFKEIGERRHILVQKRSKSIEKNGGKYAAPGGHYDLTDISTRRTAQREMEEETGWKFRINNFKLFRQTKSIDFYYLLVDNNYKKVNQTSRDEVEKINISDFPSRSILSESFGHIWVDINDFFKLDHTKMFYGYKRDVKEALDSIQD